MPSELEAALLAAVPKKFERYQTNRLKREHGKVKWQQEIGKVTARAEEVRRQYDPELMRIDANLERKVGSAIGFHCPKCGERDMGNRMEGKPWCMKCNVPLETPNPGNNRVPSMKVLPKTRRLDVTFQGLDT